MVGSEKKRGLSRVVMPDSPPSKAVIFPPEELIYTAINPELPASPAGWQHFLLSYA